LFKIAVSAKTKKVLWTLKLFFSMNFNQFRNRRSPGTVSFKVDSVLFGGLDFKWQDSVHSGKRRRQFISTQFIVEKMTEAILFLQLRQPMK
jgi:hypothetical protein